MKTKLLLSLSSLVVLTGCETLQTPYQQQQSARQQAASRYTEDRVNRLQGQVESLTSENTRLSQEVQQLRNDVRSYGGQISQLNSQMQALDAKQTRQMQDTIDQVQKLLGKMAAATPSRSTSSSRGSGYELVVEQGYTLSTIATKYGTTVDAIKKANNLKSDTIYVGQKLFIPQ